MTMSDLGFERPKPSTRPYNSFIPSPELTTWANSVFIKEKAPLYNPDHSHLLEAKIGFLWAYIPNQSQGKTTLGTAEQFNPQGNKWQVGRQKQQIKNWFNYLWDSEKDIDIPDFIITLDANWALTAKDNQFCAVVNHELTHCGQKRDLFGMPKFSSATGQPLYAIRKHDIEIFISDIELYGIDALSPEVSEAVEKAKRKPLMKMDSIYRACGVCVSK